MLLAFKLDDVSQKDCSAQEALQSSKGTLSWEWELLASPPRNYFRKLMQTPSLIGFCCLCLPFTCRVLQASVLLCLQPLNKQAENQETSLLSLPSVGTTSCIWLRYTDLPSDPEA